MIFKILICVVFLLLTLVATDCLKLNKKIPSTVWGVQTQAFRQKTEEDYYRSWDGSYQFKYDTGNNEYQSFRREKRYSDGTVIGFYGYIDLDGVLRITEYIAGRNGYRQRVVLRYPVTNDF